MTAAGGIAALIGELAGLGGESGRVLQHGRASADALRELIG
jgi:hypothetical protein